MSKHYLCILPDKRTQGSDWNKYAIVISSELKYLNGNGEEWLTDKYGNVLAKFINGNRVVVGKEVPIDVNEKTQAVN